MHEGEKGKIIPFPKKPKIAVEVAPEPREGTQEPETLGVHRLAKQNQGRSGHAIVDHVNDSFIFPEEQETITLEEAIKRAQEICEVYDPKNYEVLMRSGKMNFPLSEVDVQRAYEWARIRNTENIVRFFGWYKKEPAVYPIARVYGEAKALLERFPEVKKKE